MQQARHVVIRGHEQRRWIRERLIVRQHARVDVAVRRDHRQLGDRVVESARDRTLARVRREEPIGVQHEG
jgi:hypothetical protein